MEWLCNFNRVFRRVGACFLALLILLSVLPFKSAHGALSKEDARDKAYAAIAEELGFKKDDLVPHQSGVSEKGGFAFSFILKDKPPTSDGLVLVTFYADGTVESIQEPRDYHLSELLVNAFRHCDSKAFTVEAMYQMKLEWEPQMEALERILDELGQEGLLHVPGQPDVAYINTLKQDIRLPSDEDIAPQEALQIAKAAIAALSGWTNEKLAMFDLFVQVYYVSAEAGKPVYQFLFLRESSTSTEYANRSYDYYVKQYDEPLFAQFGGDNASTPLFVSVRVDAKTGELIEEPYVQFPPITIHPFALIR